MARAGRFGTKGLAVTFVSDETDAKTLNDVQDRFEVNVAELPDEIDISTYSKLPSMPFHCRAFRWTSPPTVIYRRYLLTVEHIEPQWPSHAESGTFKWTGMCFNFCISLPQKW